MKKSTMRILLVVGFILIILLSFRRREGFRFRLPKPQEDTSNLCNLRSQSNCLGYGSDGICQWCGTNGCRSSDEAADLNIKGCKG